MKRDPMHRETRALRLFPGSCACDPLGEPASGCSAVCYVNYFLITWLPFYLVRERHFSMDNMAKIGGAAYLLGACFAVAIRLAFRPLDRVGRDSHSRSQGLYGWRTRIGRNFPWAVRCRSGPLDSVVMLILGSVLHRASFQYVGNHADDGRTPSGRTMDRLPELRW